MRVVPLLLVAALVAGCGSGGGSSGATTNREAGRPARQTVADSVRAATRASSLHVSGRLDSRGTPLTLDLTLARGRGAKGTLTENGLAFSLVEVRSTIYIQGSDPFLRHYAGRAAAGLLHGRWLSAPAGRGRFAELAPLTSAARLFALVEGTHGRLVNEGLVGYGGQRAVEIRDTSDGSLLYVSATGTPYPVALVGGSRHPHDRLRFDRWNAPVSLSAPQHALSLSLFGLG